MIDHEIKVSFKEYASLDELEQADQQLCREAVKALKALTLHTANSGLGWLCS